MGKQSRLVVLESPYRGDVNGHLYYAVKCISDSLLRGEAPIASHVTYTASLDDDDPAQRQIGIEAGHSWLRVAEALVVYTDMGVTEGMQEGIRRADLLGVPIEYRKVRGD